MVTQTYKIVQGKIVETTWVEETPTGPVEITQTISPTTGQVTSQTVQPVGEPKPVEPKVETIKKVGETPAGGIIIEREGVRETIPPKAYEEMKREYYATMPPEEKERQRMELIESIQTQPFVEVAGKPYTISQYFEREAEIEKRRRDPLAGFIYGVSKPLTLLPSLALSPFVGEKGVESVITYHQEQQRQIQKTLMYEPERRGEIAVSGIVEPVIIGVGLGVAKIAPVIGKLPIVSKIPPIVGKVGLTAISAGILGLGTFEFVRQAPKMVSPEISVERGEAITRGSIGITGMFLGAYGVRKGWEMMFPPKKEVPREIIAIAEEEVTPKTTVREMEGYAYTKPKKELWFEPIPKREFIPPDLFKEGKIIAERGPLQIIQYQEKYWLISKVPTGRGVVPKDLIDVLRRQEKYFGRFSGVDVHLRKEVKMPVSFETPEAYKVQIYKAPDKGWGAYRKLPLEKQTEISKKVIRETFRGTDQATKEAIKYLPKPLKTTAIVTTVIAPPQVFPIISPKFREYQVQTTFPKQWEYALPKLKLKEEPKPKITPVEITVEKTKEKVTPIVAPLVTPFVGVTSVVTQVTTPQQITQQIQTQLTAQKLETLPITAAVPTTVTPPPPPPTPIPIRFGLPEGGFRRFKMRRPFKKMKMKTKYKPSLGGIMLGRRISKAPKRLFTGAEIRPVIGSKRIKKSKISFGFKRIKLGGKLKMARRKKRKSTRRRKRRKK